MDTVEMEEGILRKQMERGEINHDEYSKQMCEVEKEARDWVRQQAFDEYERKISGRDY